MVHRFSGQGIACLLCLLLVSGCGAPKKVAAGLGAVATAPKAAAKKVAPGDCKGSQAMASRHPHHRGQGTKVGILVFHDVAPQTHHDPYIITPQNLSWDFTYLKTHGYHPITLSTLHTFLSGHRKVPKKAVLITFDDGYRGTYRFALPLTEKDHFPAVLFMITGFLARYPDVHRVYSPFVSAKEAKAMLASGLWRVEGHTYAGHWSIPTMKNGHLASGHFLITRKWLPLRRRLETKGEYEARLWKDILAMTYELKNIGVCHPADFAFPFGEHNPTLDRLLNKAGYTYLYGGNHWAPATWSSPHDDIPRIDAGNTPSQFVNALRTAFPKSPAVGTRVPVHHSPKRKPQPPGRSQVL